ncbi:hypothetical protein T492DRAFT_844661 [Pavlovales sp. CCMP2436]|nr:hypothetical protein T492DRAFT_844661 [Pavlovales sp. CCMP2436]
MGGMGLGMGGLGGMMGNILEDFPRTLNQMMRIEISADQAVHVCFEDMAGYEQLQIDCNSAQGTLTVIKSELVTAETRGGRVVVSIPREAQAVKSQFANPALVGGQKKALKVNIVGQGEEKAIFDERAAAMSP